MTKKNKLRHSEYYNLQDCFDKLYAKSKQGDVFTNLVEIISSEENIRLAWAIDCWTPAGMLSANLTDSLTIKGNVFDDWHVSPSH